LAAKRRRGGDRTRSRLLLERRDDRTSASHVDRQRVLDDGDSDANASTGPKRLSPVDKSVVHVRAVRRAKILDGGAATVARDSAMAARSLIVGKNKIGSGIASDNDRPGQLNALTCVRPVNDAQLYARHNPILAKPASRPPAATAPTRVTLSLGVLGSSARTKRDNWPAGESQVCCCKSPTCLVPLTTCDSAGLPASRGLGARAHSNRCPKRKHGGARASRLSATPDLLWQLDSAPCPVRVVDGQAFRPAGEPAGSRASCLASLRSSL
jgi:hypothetical protein